MSTVQGRRDIPLPHRGGTGLRARSEEGGGLGFLRRSPPMANHRYRQISAFLSRCLLPQAYALPESSCDFAAALKWLLSSWHPEHNNYVSMDQHEGAVGPIIWSIESRKGSSTVDRNRDLKVLVQSKKVRMVLPVHRGLPCVLQLRGPLCWRPYISLSCLLSVNRFLHAPPGR